MNCPRCKLPLRTVDYEGVETDMCDACWGFWLDSGELELILDKKAIHFSKDERDIILDAGDVSDEGPSKPAPCPKCGVTMKRFHYDESVRLIVDECREHGIWLDTGEIKKVQAIAEKSKAVHGVLLRKLGLVG